MGAAARLAVALLSACVLGGWLLWGWKATLSTPRFIVRLRLLTLAYGLLWALIWLGLALVRLPYPYELEWSGGEMLDHCRRVLAGRPLYVPPGPDWFPYEYPPLYFWTSALLMRLTGLSYAAMRLVSIASTLGCAGLIFAWTRRLLRETRWAAAWGLIAAGLFLTSYRLTGAWFDIERLDMLFLFLSLLGIFLLGRGETATAGAAFCLALAFFTKQQAVLFILGGAAALAWRRQYRQLTLFTTLSLLFCLPPALALNRATHGWFFYYCFHVPATNGIKASLARKFLLEDLPLYAPTLALAIFGLRLALTPQPPLSQAKEGELSFSPPHVSASPQVWGEPDRMHRDSPKLGEGGRGEGEEGRAIESPKSKIENPEDLAVLCAMTVMGLLGSLLSRAHWGGDQNVLMAGYLFTGTAACVIAGRLEAVRPQVAPPLYALVLAQMLALFYRPDAQLPTEAGRRAGQEYQRVVQEMEQGGEVLCLDHGGFTTPAHFQVMGLLDIMNAEKQFPPGLAAALRSHRYAAIVVDTLPDRNGLFGKEILSSYAPAQRLHFTTSWIVTGYPTPGPTHPVWILRPSQKTP